MDARARSHATRTSADNSAPRRTNNATTPADESERAATCSGRSPLGARVADYDKCRDPSCHTPRSQSYRHGAVQNRPLSHSGVIVLHAHISLTKHTNLCIRPNHTYITHTCITRKHLRRSMQQCRLAGAVADVDVGALSQQSHLSCVASTCDHSRMCNASHNHASTTRPDHKHNRAPGPRSAGRRTRQAAVDETRSPASWVRPSPTSMTSMLTMRSTH
jgi:hypothetical protein